MTDLSTFWVGDWRVDPATGRVERGGRERSLRPRTMDLLVCLAEREGELLPRQEALETVWPDVVVKESALTNCVSEIREALDDSGREQRTVKTVVKRGYVLLAPVRREPARGEPFGREPAHRAKGTNGHRAGNAVQRPEAAAAPSAESGRLPLLPGAVLVALVAWMLFLGYWSG